MIAVGEYLANIFMIFKFFITSFGDFLDFLSQILEIFCVFYIQMTHVKAVELKHWSIYF